MLSGVLNSDRAIQVNIEIMRAFVRLRLGLQTYKDLARRISRLEKKYDSRFRVVFDALRALVEPPEEPPKRRIGFHAELDSVPVLPPHRGTKAGRAPTERGSGRTSERGGVQRHGAAARVLRARDGRGERI